MHGYRYQPQLCTIKLRHLLQWNTMAVLTPSILYSILPAHLLFYCYPGPRTAHTYPQMGHTPGSDERNGSVLAVSPGHLGHSRAAISPLYQNNI